MGHLLVRGHTHKAWAAWTRQGSLALRGHHSFKMVGSVTFEFLNATGGVIDPPPSDWDIWYIQP